MSAIQPPQTGLAYLQTVKRFGTGVKLITSYLTLTDANKPTAILTNDPDRLFWLAINRSPYHVEIAFDQGFVLGTAILLSPNGGSASMAIDEDGEATSYAVWIASPVAPFQVYLAFISHP